MVLLFRELTKTGEETWDVEQSDHEEERHEPSTQLSFAPSSTITPKSRLKALKPLKIQDPQWYRKARFKQVLSVNLP